MYNGLEVFGKGLAVADENQQAGFINAFSEALRSVCAQGHGWETQCCYIAKHLHEGSREVLKSLVEFAELAIEERRKCSLEIQNIRGTLEVLEQRKKFLENEIANLESIKGI